MGKITRDHLAILPLDSSLDAETFEIATQLAGMIERALGTSAGIGPMKPPDWQSKYLAFYYGLRIHGVFGGAIVSMAHALHREAQFFERACYEYFLKMFYYSHFRNRAQEMLTSMPAQQLKLINKLGFDPKALMDNNLLSLAESGPAASWDANFKQMRDDLIADGGFMSQTTPAAKFFVKENENRWRVSWIGASQIVHGTMLDAAATITPDMEEPTFHVTLGSRLPKPNASLLDLCQYPVFTILHLKALIGLQEPPELEKAATRVAELIAKRDELDND